MCSTLRVVSQRSCSFYFFLNVSYFSQIFTELKKLYFLKYNAIGHP